MAGKAKLDIAGLRGVWGLEQLERTGLGAGKLAWILVGGGIAASVLLYALLARGVPGAGWVPFWVAAFHGALIGITVLATIALARSTQADLEGLLPVAPEVSPALALLNPSRGLLAALVMLMSLMNLLAVNVSALMTMPDQSMEGLVAYWSQPWAFFIVLVLTPLAGGIQGVLYATFATQVRALTHAARRIDVDVLELDQYPRVANPVVRVVVFGIVLLSLFPGLFVLEDSILDRIMSLVTPVTVLILLVVIGAYGYPVWILKKRIRAAKDAELGYVFRSLRGDTDAMTHSRIAGRAGSLTFSELLDYRAFIESLWDWPVAPYVHRILLIGLLPPTTWVLAGLVEHAIGAMAGS